jgi:ketosteroid isomerase-like protein
MSRENVEIVRRVHDAADRRDAATVYALYDTEVELDASRVEIAGFTARDVYRGHEGLRRFFREWHEAWENVTYDFEELIDRGDHVIAVVTRRARGRASGADVEWRLALLWTLRAGKVVRLAWFPTPEDAAGAIAAPEANRG